MSTKRLAPNSEEWLAELAKINPRQAAMTRATVERAGSEDVCSICGDRPAQDYAKDDAVLLVRLCNDCRLIQGGGLTPIN